MTVDATPLGELCAETMESIGNRFEHVDDDVEVGICAVIVEVDTPGSSVFVWSFNDDRPWVLKAFLKETLKEVKRRERRARLEAELDDD